MGLRNSSLSISPGVTSGIFSTIALLMVVCDLNSSSDAVVPQEADSPLIIDSDAVLAFSIARKTFKAVARWDPHIA